MTRYTRHRPSDLLPLKFVNPLATQQRAPEPLDVSALHRFRREPSAISQAIYSQAELTQRALVQYLVVADGGLLGEVSMLLNDDA